MKNNKIVLIAEDEKDLLSLLSKSFKDQGFKVISAQDGKIGLELSQKEKPDLILADILMPEMDGIEMVKKIRESCISCPVIFLTNFGDPDHVSRAIEISNSDYIVKSDMQIEDIISRAKNKLQIK